MKNDNKQIKASKWVLTLLFILSAVVLILFFGVGFGNEAPAVEGGKFLQYPQFTGLLIVWLYVLVGICILAVLAFGIAAAIKNIKYKKSGAKRTGFAGWIFLFTAATVAVSYFLAGREPVLLGDKKTYCEDVFDLVLSDVCIISIAVLFVVVLLCSVLSMLGVFKARR